MSRVVGFIRRLIEKGFSPEDALDIAEMFEENEAQSTQYAPDSDARRRQAYRDEGLTTAAWVARRQEIFARDGRVCRYCADTAGPFHIDHIRPVSRGGTSERDNLCVACHSCNRSKKNRTVEEWGGRK